MKSLAVTGLCLLCLGVSPALNAEEPTLKVVRIRPNLDTEKLQYILTTERKSVFERNMEGLSSAKSTRTNAWCLPPFSPLCAIAAPFRRTIYRRRFVTFTSLSAILAKVTDSFGPAVAGSP